MDTYIWIIPYDCIFLSWCNPGCIFGLSIYVLYKNAIIAITLTSLRCGIRMHYLLFSHWHLISAAVIIIGNCCKICIYVGKYATRGGCETHPLLNMEWFPRCLSIKYSLSYSVFVSMSKKRREDWRGACAAVFVIIRFPHLKTCKHYLLHQNKCKEPIVPAICCLVKTTFLLNH